LRREEDGRAPHKVLSEEGFSFPDGKKEVFL